MLEEIERGCEPGIAERSLGGWRAVAAAWLVAILFVVLFATGDALASRHHKVPRNSSVATAVIPRHDPSAPDEIAASRWLDRVRAEAYGM
jgi:hypothetical protein